MGSKNKSRPPPLSIHKKLPASRLHQEHMHHPPATMNRKLPIITYTYSPRPIKTDEHNFRWVVQRMTGCQSTQMRCHTTGPHIPIANINAARRCTSNISADHIVRPSNVIPAIMTGQLLSQTHVNFDTIRPMLQQNQQQQIATMKAGDLHECRFQIASDEDQREAAAAVSSKCKSSIHSISSQLSPKHSICFQRPNVSSSEAIINLDSVRQMQTAVFKKHFSSETNSRAIVADHESQHQSKTTAEEVDSQRQLLVPVAEHLYLDTNMSCDPNCWQLSDWNRCRRVMTCSPDDIQSPGSLSYQETVLALFLSQQADE